MKTFGVIDIGSNSVRLLLWADGQTIYKKINTTRLGAGVEKTGRLSAEAIARTAHAVAAFKQEAERAGARKVLAFATAAVRSAANGADFTSAVKDLCGLSVEVVSGETEAKLGLIGALGGKDGGIIDVGGASTEVTVARGGRIVYAVSADVGAVRLRDACGEERAALETFIAERIAVYGEVPPFNAYAIGGTATSLAALALELEPYDPAQTDGLVLTAADVLRWAEKLLSLSMGERLALKGMDPRRADVLGGGALLLYRVMRAVGAEQVTVSEKDNMEGYLVCKMREGVL